MQRRFLAAMVMFLLPWMAFAEDFNIDVSGAGEGTLRFENHDVILIGRDETNHVRLRGSFVSRSHAKITCFGSGCLLTDLRSTNGTALNGRPVPYGKNAVLRDRDEIRVGDFTLRISIR